MSSWPRPSHSNSKILLTSKFSGKQKSHHQHKHHQQQSQPQTQQPRRRNRNRNRNRRNRRRRPSNIFNNQPRRPHSFPLIVMITETDSDDENSDDEQLNRILGRFGFGRNRFNQQQTEQQHRQQDERRLLFIDNELKLFSQSIIDEIEQQLMKEFESNELYYNRLIEIMENIIDLVVN